MAYHPQPQAASVLQLVGQRFLVQPIVCAHSLRIHALELLSRQPPALQDRQLMLALDVAALHAASLLSRALGIAAHCNAEIYSLMHPRWLARMQELDLSAVTVEIVERHDLLQEPLVFQRLSTTTRQLRAKGARIALDDVTGSPLEMRLIAELKPVLVKAESAERARWFLQSTSCTVALERVEEAPKWCLAPSAHYLQGYWCDRCVAHQLPPCLLLPGVLHRYRVP